jgi:hypothetical protein
VTALLAAGLSASAGVAYADSVVILGAGQIGNWITSGSMANPNSSPIDVRVTLAPCSVIPTCTLNDFSLPALGSASLPFSSAGFHFGTAYVTQLNPSASGQLLPVVQATLTDQVSCQLGDDPSTDRHQSAEIPVVPLSKLIAANPSTLNFPNVLPVPEASRFTLVSNLVLGNIQRADGVAGEDLPLLLELFGPDGNLVGSTSLTLSYGETRVVGDVASLLGGRPPILFFPGQLRVTRVSGKALMWGILYTLNSSFGVAVSTGVNLSP